MARTMARDDDAFRVVINVIWIGPDDYRVDYKGDKYLYRQHGAKYANDLIYGPYSTRGMAASQGSRETKRFREENDAEWKKGHPAVWRINVEVQKADTQWVRCD